MAKRIIIDPVEMGDSGALSRDKINSNFSKLDMALDEGLNNVTDELGKEVNRIDEEIAELGRFKGYFEDETLLRAAVPNPMQGDYAWVGYPYPGIVWMCRQDNLWINTSYAPKVPAVDLTSYAKNGGSNMTVQDLDKDTELLKKRLYFEGGPDSYVQNIITPGEGAEATSIQNESPVFYGRFDLLFGKYIADVTFYSAIDGELYLIYAKGINTENYSYAKQLISVVKGKNTISIEKQLASDETIGFAITDFEVDSYGACLLASFFDVNPFGGEVLVLDAYGHQLNSDPGDLCVTFTERIFTEEERGDILKLQEGKVDKEEGKGLSSNDYTNEDKGNLGNKADKSLEDGSKVVYAKETDAVNGDVIVYEDGKYINKNLGAAWEDTMYYGVEWDETVADTALTRIGNPFLHRTLPIHNKMRGCLLSDDGKVNKYLNPNDWTGETLDGSQGQVMVEIPEHYRKFESDGNIRRIKVSEYPLQGYEKVHRMYVSAFEASMQKSTSKLCSVMSIDSDYRGGRYNVDYSELDGTTKSLLGKPITNLSSSYTLAMQYARNRNVNIKNWVSYIHDVHTTLVFLYFVEYANKKMDLPFTDELTTEGYKQGGLGKGASGIAWQDLSTYNSHNPIISSGYTNILGNNSGVTIFTMPDDFTGSVKTVYPNRYRGLENFFGHLSIVCSDLIYAYDNTDEYVPYKKCLDLNNIGSFDKYVEVARIYGTQKGGGWFAGFVKEMSLPYLLPTELNASATTFYSSTLRWSGSVNSTNVPRKTISFGSSLSEQAPYPPSLLSVFLGGGTPSSEGLNGTRLVYLTEI